jgi:putative FmdB family regulatory protein
MPIHEYACHACGHEFETLVRAAEQPSCASCGSTALQKKLSVFAAHGGGTADIAPSACGTCGDPGGPGACKLN